MLINENNSKVDEGHKSECGFSLIELLVSLVLTLIILGIAVLTFSSALGSRNRESSTTDAVTSAQAALNIMTREIGNAGFGLTNSNGIVLSDSDGKGLRVRSNTDNSDASTDDPGEDLVFYYDSASQSVVRYDTNLSTTSGVINRVSNVDFLYHNYNPDGTFSSGSSPAANTGRVTIILQVILTDVVGQPSGRIVTVRSDVTLRNSPYNLGQY